MASLSETFENDETISTQTPAFRLHQFLETGLSASQHGAFLNVANDVIEEGGAFLLLQVLGASRERGWNAYKKVLSSQASMAPRVLATAWDRDGNCNAAGWLLLTDNDVWISRLSKHGLNFAWRNSVGRPVMAFLGNLTNMNKILKEGMFFDEKDFLNKPLPWKKRMKRLEKTTDLVLNMTTLPQWRELKDFENRSALAFFEQQMQKSLLFCEQSSRNDAHQEDYRNFLMRTQAKMEQKILRETLQDTGSRLPKKRSM